jgi:uncharacterized protein YcfL
MRNAKLTILLSVAAFAASGCHKQGAQDQNQSMAIDEGVPDNQVAVGNAEIETLPADESSTTPSNQLQNGSDNPDVNGLGTTNSE